MGAINFSIDIELVKFLKRLLPINTFVETGTYEGDTINAVLNYFQEIYSVEISTHYYEKSRLRFSDKGHVHLYQHNSPEFIQQILSDIKNRSCLYWLDAHWCATEGNELESSQCPLVEEIKSIGTLNDKSIILIDDARLFLCSPPKPHIIDQWPTLSEIIRELQNISNNHEIIILNDVILYAPLSIGQELNLYAHQYGIDWLIIKHQSMNTENLLDQTKKKESEIVNLSANIENLLDQLREKDIEIASLSEIASERYLLLQAINDEAAKRLDRMKSLSEHIAWQSEEISLQEALNSTQSERISILEAQINSQEDKISQQDKQINSQEDIISQQDKQINSQEDIISRQDKQINSLEAQYLASSKLALEFRQRYESTLDFKTRQKLEQVYQLLQINKVK